MGKYTEQFRGTQPPCSNCENLKAELAELQEQYDTYRTDHHDSCADRLDAEQRAEKAGAEWDHWKGRYEQAVKEGNARFAEMDDRCHRTEYALSQAEARLRTTAQILISEIGAEGPKNAECAAKEAVQIIKNLRAEIALQRQKELKVAVSAVENHNKLVDRLSDAEGLLDKVACGGYQGRLGTMVSDIEVFLEKPTPAKPATVEADNRQDSGVAFIGTYDGAYTPAPELTEEERGIMEEVARMRCVTKPNCPIDPTFYPKVASLAERGLVVWGEPDRDGYRQYSLTPAGRAAIEEGEG